MVWYGTVPNSVTYLHYLIKTNKNKQTWTLMGWNSLNSVSITFYSNPLGILFVMRLHFFVWWLKTMYQKAYYILRVSRRGRQQDIKKINVVYAHKYHNEIIQIKIVTSRSEEIFFLHFFLFAVRRMNKRTKKETNFRLIMETRWHKHAYT